MPILAVSFGEKRILYFSYFGLSRYNLLINYQYIYRERDVCKTKENKKDR